MERRERWAPILKYTLFYTLQVHLLLSSITIKSKYNVLQLHCVRFITEIGIIVPRRYKPGRVCVERER